MGAAEAEGGLAPDQSAPRAAPSLSAPIDFYYKNFTCVFFVSRTPRARRLTQMRFI